jgi:hypothetical protein
MLLVVCNVVDEATQQAQLSIGQLLVTVAMVC